MISNVKVGETRLVEVGAADNIKLTAKVHPFHTDSLTYSHWERSVYHDRRDCAYGQMIRQDGNAVLGTADRRRCDRCADLSEGVEDLFPGDSGG